jgi:hypothetical protein
MRGIQATLVAMTIVGVWTSADAQVVARPERLSRPILEGPVKLQQGPMKLQRLVPGPTNLRTSGSPAYAWLGWDAVAGATGYLVTRTDATGAATTLTSSAITDPNYNDYSGLTPGRTYTYTVSAVYANGNLGPSQVTYTTPQPVGPAWVRAEVNEIGGFGVTWPYTPGANGFYVIQTTPNGQTLSNGWAGAGASAMGNNLHGVSLSNSAPPGTYVFRVEAYYHPNVRTPAEMAPRDTVTKP